MYILAFGNIKSVYLCPEVQSTKLSKHARLQPFVKPFYCGLGPAREQNAEDDSDAENPNKDVRRAFKEIVMSKDKQRQEIVFQDHVDLTQKYLDIVSMVDRAKRLKRSEDVPPSELVTDKSKKREFINVGQTVGQRALVDSQTIEKHIASHKERYCQRMGVDLKDAEDQLREVVLHRQKTGLREKEMRANAIKQQYKFCKPCFEKGVAKCDCLLLKLSTPQRALALKEEAAS